MKSLTTETTNCPHCDIELPIESRFCPACGQNIMTQQLHESGNLPGNYPVQATLGAQPTCFPKNQPQAASSELQSGDRFANRYEIIRPLGRGGMGAVYLAKDEVADKETAIKIVNTEFVSDSDARRLVDEGMLARDIRHRNVVAVYDADVYEGQPFLTMEYVEGTTLRQLLRQKQMAGESFSLAEATGIILQIVNGLEAAHQSQVVHRDLKPENVMVVPDDKGGYLIKILDFGIAKHETQSRDSGSTAGTLGYMSPEQFTSADLVGPSSDLYSLSVIYYELLVGALPRGHWQPPSEGRDDIPKSIDQLIETGLSNRALNRPQTAAAYRQAIKNAAEQAKKAGWKIGLDQLQNRFGGSWNSKWNFSEMKDWWTALSLQTKTWIILGFLLVAGIFGVLLEEIDQATSEPSDTFSSAPLDPHSSRMQPINNHSSDEFWN